MNFQKKLSVAYAWNMLGMIAVRSMGLVSTLVLVRLLNPEDFGLMALAAMVIGYFQILSSIGLDRYLILNKINSEEFFNSGWTIVILLKLLLASVLIIQADNIASLLAHTELEEIITVLALVNVLGAFRNVGMVKFEQDVNYRPQNTLLVYSKVFSFVTTLGAAYYFRNYYALLLGASVQTLASVVISYVLSSYRPKICFNVPSGMLSFSLFLALRNIIGFTRSQIDVFLVGKSYSSSDVGVFKVAREFSIMPLTELVDPLFNPLFSAISSIKENRQKVIQKIYQVLFLSWFMTFCCALTFIIVQVEFVSVVLGDKWVTMSPFVGILSVLMIPFVTQRILFIVYDIENKIKVSLLSDGLGIFAIISSFFLYQPDNLEKFAILRVYVGIGFFLSIIVLARLFLPISMKKLTTLISIPLVSSLITYITINYLRDIIELNVFSSLLLYSALTPLLYLLSALALIRLLSDKYFREIYEMIPTDICNLLVRYKIIRYISIKNIELATHKST